MQDKPKMKKRLGLLVKILVPIICIFILFQRISQAEALDCLTVLLEGNAKVVKLNFILIAVALMPVNWLLESFKWFLIINKAEKISYFTSIKATLSGLSVSILFPFRIGEYLGRINYIKKKRLGVLLTVVGSMTQLIATLLFGVLALFLVEQSLFTDYHIKWISWLTVSAVFTIIIGLKFFPIWIKNLIKWDKAKKVFTQMSRITSIQLLFKIQLLSMLRYLVFTSQYMLFFYAFGFEISMLYLFSIIALMYLATTAIPVNQIVELGTSKSLILVSLISTLVELNEYGTCWIAVIGFSIWLLNIVVPSLIGLIFLTIHKKSLIE